MCVCVCVCVSREKTNGEKLTGESEIMFTILATFL